MLSINHLSTGYGKRQVLFDISFDISEGEIVLLIGSNGSGKSTLLKAIYGLLPVWNKQEKGSKATIQFHSEDISKMDSSTLLSKGLLYIPQKNNCFEDLTVKENLYISGLSLRNMKLFKLRYQKILLEFPELKDLINSRPMKLSGGEKQILTLAMALIHQPKMILMDEPFAGLSQRNIETVQNRILNLNKTLGITFLIIEHRIKESYIIAHKLISLKLGKVFSIAEMNTNFNINNLNEVFI